MMVVSLSDFTSHSAVISEEARKSFASLKSNPLQLLLQLVNCVEFLHNERVAHLDIKPGNFFWSCSNAEFKVVLGDFGQSIDMSSFGDTYVLPPKESVGTTGYNAPELTSERKVGYSSDIYALGITLLELVAKPRDLSLDNPRVLESALNFLLRQLRQSLTLELFQRARKILIEMVSADSSKRPKIREIKQFLQQALFQS